MSDFQWPGSAPVGDTPAEPVMIDLEQFAAFLNSGRPEPRMSETPVPGPEGYVPAEHLPYGHTTGQHVLDPGPGSLEEEALRRHIGALVVDMLDRAVPEQVRVAAMAKVLADDGPRALGLLAQLLNDAWDAVDAHHEMPPNTSLESLRKALEGTE